MVIVWVYLYMFKLLKASYLHVLIFLGPLPCKLLANLALPHAHDLFICLFHFAFWLLFTCLFIYYIHFKITSDPC